MEIEFEHLKVITSAVSVDKDHILPGALYMAKRNTGWKLLTCRGIDHKKGLVFPVETAYVFDAHECYRVLDIR